MAREPWLWCCPWSLLLLDEPARSVRAMPCNLSSVRLSRAWNFRWTFCAGRVGLWGCNMTCSRCRCGFINLKPDAFVRLRSKFFFLRSMRWWRRHHHRKRSGDREGLPTIFHRRFSRKNKILSKKYFIAVECFFHIGGGSDFHAKERGKYHLTLSVYRGWLNLDRPRV